MIKFEGCLLFGASIDCGKKGGVLKIHIAVFTMFLVCSDSRHVPLALMDLAFMHCHPSFGLASDFANVGILSVVLAVTVGLADYLPRGKFCPIYPT